MFIVRTESDVGSCLSSFSTGSAERPFSLYNPRRVGLGRPSPLAQAVVKRFNELFSSKVALSPAGPVVGGWLFLVFLSYFVFMALAGFVLYTMDSAVSATDTIVPIYAALVTGGYLIAAFLVFVGCSRRHHAGNRRIVTAWLREHSAQVLHQLQREFPALRLDCGGLADEHSPSSCTCESTRALVWLSIDEQRGTAQ